MIERIEVLETVKLGRGPDRTYYKGRILEEKDITDVIRNELSKNTGTLRKLDASVGVSPKEVFVSKPQFIDDKKKEVKNEKPGPSEEATKRTRRSSRNGSN